MRTGFNDHEPGQPGIVNILHSALRGKVPVSIALELKSMMDTAVHHRLTHVIPYVGQSQAGLVLRVAVRILGGG